MTDRRAFVHIGLPKTGTSSLSGALRRSPDQLHEQGFTVLDRLPGQVATVDTPDLLVTQETLAAATQQQVRALVDGLDGFEVHVVVAARDLARQIPVAWQQRLLARKVYPFERFREAVVERKPLAADFWASQDLPAVLDRWGGAVPAERIHVVTVPPHGAAPTLLPERFCGILGVDPARLDTESPRGDSSLGIAQAEVLRRVNIALGDRLPHPREGYAAMGKLFLAGEILAPQRGLSVRLPGELADWCIETARSWIAAVGAGGYQVAGDLGELVPDRSAFEPHPEVSDADILDAAAEALAAILDLRSRERQDLAELEDQVTALEEELDEMRADEADTDE